MSRRIVDVEVAEAKTISRPHPKGLRPKSKLLSAVLSNEPTSVAEAF